MPIFVCKFCLWYFDHKNKLNLSEVYPLYVISVPSQCNMHSRKVERLIQHQVKLSAVSISRPSSSATILHCEGTLCDLLLCSKQLNITVVSLANIICTANSFDVVWLQTIMYLIEHVYVCGYGCVWVHVGCATSIYFIYF